jgi:acyl-CoA reductase-like NAD-dependent aldehyde dehydrogenase
MSPASAAKLTAEAGVTEIPMLIGGEWRTAAESYEVRDPYRNTVVARAPRSALTDLDDALDAAVKAKAKAAATPAFERATWRTDQLAYGGVKDSGIGREGPRYSIRDMTEERMVLFNY